MPHKSDLRARQQPPLDSPTVCLLFALLPPPPPPPPPKYNRATLESEWIVGGTDGTLDIIGLDGRHMGATATAFSGQHNLEYFGEVRRASRACDASVARVWCASAVRAFATRASSSSVTAA
jgi:hypothetical protein